VQQYFAAEDGKRFLSSDITQDLPVLTVTDMHVLTLARMLNVLQLLVLDLCELLQILCFIHSAVLQPHTTSQSKYRLLRLIVYRLNAITGFRIRFQNLKPKPFIREKHSSHKLPQKRISQ